MKGVIEKILSAELVAENIAETAHSQALQDTAVTVVLKHGRKNIKIVLYETGEGWGADTYIENVSDGARRENETTALYLAVHKLLQRRADETSRRVRWLFTTHDKNLMKWAKTFGTQFFPDGYQWKDTDSAYVREMFFEPSVVTSSAHQNNSSSPSHPDGTSRIPSRA